MASDKEHFKEDSIFWSINVNLSFFIIFYNKSFTISLNDLIALHKLLIRMVSPHVLIQRTRSSIFSIAVRAFIFQHLRIVRLHVRASRIE